MLFKVLHKVSNVDFVTVVTWKLSFFFFFSPTQRFNCLRHPIGLDIQRDIISANQSQERVKMRRRTESKQTIHGQSITPVTDGVYYEE